MYQKGSETMEIVFKDTAPGGIALRNFGPSPLQQSVRFSFNLHTELDSLDADMHYYASEALKTIELCEQRNLQVMKTMGKLEGSVREFPIIIDERRAIWKLSPMSSI